MGEVIKFDTWIQDDTAPVTIKVRQKYEPEQDEVRDEQNRVVTPGHPELHPWPEGHYVHIKAIPASGDAVLAKRLSVEGEFHIGPSGAQGNGKLAWYLGGLVSCAIMITGFEGPMFRDPKTGSTFDFADCGDPDPFEAAKKRLAKLQRGVPSPIIEFVTRELAKREADPLGLSETESGTSSSSAPSSTPRPPQNDESTGAQDG